MNGYIGTEQEYLELEKLSLKLGIPVPMVHLERKIELDGEVVKQVKDRSHTWNRNYWNAIYCTGGGFAGTSAAFGTGYLCNKTLVGTLQAPSIYAFNGIGTYWIGPAGTDTYGILAGTGTAAEDFENHLFGTLISHGTSAGTLSYNAMNPFTASYVAGTKVWTTSLSRIFNNNSGGTIVVGEICIMSYNGGNPLVVNRDLLSSTDSLLSGAQYTVTYTITLTFPA